MTARATIENLEHLSFIDELSLAMHLDFRAEVEGQVKQAGKLKRFEKNAILMYSIEDDAGNVFVREATVGKAMIRFVEEYPHKEVVGLSLRARAANYWR